MAFRAMRGIVFAAIVLLATPFSVSAQEITDGSLQVRHAVLASSIDRISSESRTFREAVEALALTGRRAILTTPDQVVDFDRAALAQAFPLSDERLHVDTVVVVVNLELLQRLSG